MVLVIEEKMPDEKNEPKLVSSSASVEQYQKGKKCKKNFQKNSRQNKLKNVSVQNDVQEMGSASVLTTNSQKDWNTSQNLKDFPQLVEKSHGVRSFKKTERSEPQFQKSWRSFVSCRGHERNSDETFPTLPHVGRNNFVINKNDKPNKTSCKQENSVLDKALDNRTYKQEENVKQENNHPKLPPLKQTAQTHQSLTKKKRADPVLINLKEMLEVNKAHRKTKQHKAFKNKESLRFHNNENLSGNILDSSNPKRNRGKHREIKKKKLTKLKLVIMKERIINKKIKENQMEGNLCNEYDDLIENINFKEEIVKYVNELDEKKKKMKEAGKNKNKENINEDIKKEKEEEKLIENKDECQKVSCLKEKNKGNVKKSNVDNNISKGKEDKGVSFSCKVREYCDNIITPALNSAVTEMIKEVVSLQDKIYARDSVKAKAKRRHVSGFREVKKFLNLKKVKIIVIPPNLEKLQMKGSVFDLISELKEMAIAQNVPYVFALDRFKLGNCTRKCVPVSAFAVLNYEGLEERFKNVLLHLQEARQQFVDRMSKATLKVEEEDLQKDKEQTADTVLKTVEAESREEIPDEDVSQRISTFLSSLRELSSKNKPSGSG